MRFARTLFTVLVAGSLAGCMLFPGKEERAMQKSPSFRQGYEDGCAAASTGGANPREQPYRDNALYQGDAAYRAGWGNGYSLCRSNMNTPSSPAGNPAFGTVPGSH